MTQVPVHTLKDSTRGASGVKHIHTAVVQCRFPFTGSAVDVFVSVGGWVGGLIEQ